MYKLSFLVVLSALLCVGCSQNDSAKQLEANKQLVLTFWNTFYNEKNVEKAFQVFAENAVYESFATGAVDSGRATIQQKEEGFPKAFPDGKSRSEGIYAEGDYVVLRWYADGTNTVSLMGMPPTNKFVAMHGVQVFHIVNGKIQHVWDYWNMADFLRQMGMGG